MLSQRSRGVFEGEILANQRRWIAENMEEWEGSRQLLNVWLQSTEGLLNVAPKKNCWTKMEMGMKKSLPKNIREDFID